VTLKNTILTLMGVPYAHPAIEPVKPTEPVRRALDPVDPNLAMEEQKITAIQRTAYLSFAPILPMSDPVVQAATFRNRFEPTGASEAERRARALRAQQADAPVEPRREPLITVPQIEPPISTVERWRRSLTIATANILRPLH
jgi:hypothetical protein